MNTLRPKYGWYLLWWIGPWLLLTVTTQLPECYQRSVALDAGTQAYILADLKDFAASRACIEVPFGLFWASISWYLQPVGIYLLRWLRTAKFLHKKDALFLLFKWPILSATVLVAVMEGVIFGLPLSRLYTSLANFSMLDDEPMVTISDQSIFIESTGIVLAFVLPTLVAGYMTGRTIEMRQQLSVTQTPP